MSGPDAPLPPRRRVTAPRPIRSATARGVPDTTRTPDASSGPAEADPATIYLRTLIRAQLRVGVVCGIGLALTMTVASVLIATTPALDAATVGGVPWSWLLQAYGMYPLIVIFAVVYVRSAARNEARYQSLAGGR